MAARLNKENGTVEFDLGSVPCVLKATWKAIAGIEHDLGFGMVALARRVLSREFGLQDLAVVVFHGLKESGTASGITLEKVSEQIFKAGLLNPELLGAVTLFCEFALSGGEEPKKETAAE